MASGLLWVLIRTEISQDTLFDYLVFNPSQFLHHDVYKAGNQTGEEADQPAHHPATDLQTAETLKHKTEEKGRERPDNSFKGLRTVLICVYVLLLVHSPTIYHITHPPLLFQKQLVLDVIIVQTLEEQTSPSVCNYTGTL